MADIERLDARITKLEGQGAIHFFFQYVFAPVLVLVLGALLNFQLEHQRERLHRLEVAQEMVSKLFTGNHYQVFATQRLLTRVLEPETAKELNDIIDQYYRSLLQADLKTGNVEAVASVYSAAESVGGPAAQQVVAQVMNDPQKLAKVEAVQLAARKEHEGFEQLAAQQYEAALQSFEEAERAYPGYHYVYEIGRLLRKQKVALSAPETRPEAERRIQTEILQKYSAKAPPSALEQMRQQSIPPN